MKRLLPFLAPFIIILLSATPFAIYKDKVKFAPSTAPATAFSDPLENVSLLSPSHWSLVNYQVSSVAGSSSADLPIGSVANEPLSSHSRRFGFPFGAYLSKHSDAGNFDAVAMSWIWALVDLTIFIGSVILSLHIILKRRRLKKRRASA